VTGQIISGVGFSRRIGNGEVVWLKLEGPAVVYKVGVLRRVDRVDPPMTSSQYNFISITRACNVFKECGPMITSILRKCLQFNTWLIFIPTYIPSSKLSGFQHILNIYCTKVVVMLVGRRYCTHAQ
jgi:hypothetical protein